MIRQQSDDPDVAAAASEAADIVRRVLGELPRATTFDYGGHRLQVGEYGLCERCTTPIAEAQQACQALQTAADIIDDPTVKEHVQLAVDLFRLEAEAAQIRAELHNGQGSEQIVNAALGFLYDRHVHDDYDHTHHGDN